MRWESKHPLAGVCSLWSVVFTATAFFCLRRSFEREPKYNQDLVQHDLFRELAIHMSKQEPLENRRRLIIDLYGNQNHPPERWPKQQSSHLSVASPTILSISTDQNITPDWCNDIQVAATVVLVLNLRTSEYTLPEFIKEMKNLKVLVVTNYGYSKTDLRNLQLLGSLLSLKRIRLQKVSIPSLCDLKNVHKLSLYMCDMKQAFENSSFNFSEAMPKLEHLSIEYCQDLVKLPTGFCLYFDHEEPHHNELPQLYQTT